MTWIGYDHWFDMRLHWRLKDADWYIYIYIYMIKYGIDIQVGWYDIAMIIESVDDIWMMMNVLGTIWKHMIHENDSWTKREVNRKQRNETEIVEYCIACLMCIAYDLKELSTVYFSHWDVDS